MIDQSGELLSSKFSYKPIYCLLTDTPEKPYFQQPSKEKVKRVKEPKAAKPETYRPERDFYEDGLKELENYRKIELAKSRSGAYRENRVSLSKHQLINGLVDLFGRCP